MNYEVAIYRLLAEWGVNPYRVTSTIYMRAAIAVRPDVATLLKDAAKASMSLVGTSTGVLTLPPEIEAGRETQCRTNECGRFGTLSDGEPVCHACSCAGAFLRSKWKNPLVACPVTNKKTLKPYWPTYKGKKIEDQPT